MKFLHFAVILLFVFTACNKMESSEPDAPAQALMATADGMNKAIVNRDFTTFIKYTHPKIIEVMGGQERFRQMTEQSAKGMDESGVKFIGITNGKPGKIISKDGELQTTLPQTIEMQTPDGRVKTRATMLAISKDDGKTWYFLNTSNADLKKLQELLPNLSNELVIPPPQKPEFSKE